MCNPLLFTLGGAALSGVQMVQRQNEIEAMGEAQASQAISTRNQQQAALEAQAIEEQRQASQQASAADMEAARTVSEARVASSESGIAGAGVNRLTGEIGRQAGEAQAVSASNLRRRISNLNIQRENIDDTLGSQLEQIDRATEAPSVLSQALTIGSGAISGFATGQQAISTFGSGDEFVSNVGSFLKDPGSYQSVSGRAAATQAARTGRTAAYEPLSLRLMGLPGTANAFAGGGALSKSIRNIRR